MSDEEGCLQDVSVGFGSSEVPSGQFHKNTEVKGKGLRADWSRSCALLLTERVTWTSYFFFLPIIIVLNLSEPQVFVWSGDSIAVR